MAKSHPAERRRGGRRTALMNGITLLMTKSMVFYVAAVLVQRTWTLLNSNVMRRSGVSRNLFRPMHATNTGPRGPGGCIAEMEAARAAGYRNSTSL